MVEIRSLEVVILNGVLFIFSFLLFLMGEVQLTPFQYSVGYTQDIIPYFPIL